MRDIGALDADLEALKRVAMRFAGSAEERRMLEAVRERLPEGVTARVEGLVCHPAPLFILGVHGVFAFGAGLLGLGWPKLGAAAMLLVAASLVGEGTGRLPLLRWWLPKVPSYNLVLPPEEGTAVVGTVVLVTPLDVPRARLWRPRWLRRPVAAVFHASVLLLVLLLLRSLAEPWGNALLALYVGALAVQGVTGALAWVSRREPTHVASDAGGPAVVLEVLRRVRAAPVPGVATWVVFSGAGRAHQEGMDAFLTLRGARMQEPVLVVAVCDAARPPLRAVLSEGPLWPQHQRPTGPALIERMRWAGRGVPFVDRPEPSDARVAMLLGYRALCLAGGEGAPSTAAAAEAADVVETVVRWFGDDLGHLVREREAGRAPGLRLVRDVDEVPAP